MTTKKEKKPNNRTMLEFEQDAYAILKEMHELEKRKGHNTKIIELSSRICIDISEGKYDFLLPRKVKKEEMKRKTVGLYIKPFKDAKDYTKGKFTHVTEMVERVLFFKKGKRLVNMQIEVENLEKFEQLLSENGMNGVFKIRKTDY